MCNIPNDINTSFPKKYVTTLKNSATTKSFNPLLRLEWDKLQHNPEIKIKIPAKRGSTGLKNINNSFPIFILNIKDIV